MIYRFVFLWMTLILASATAFGQLPPAPANLTATFENPTPNSWGSVRLQWQMPAAGQWAFVVFRSAHDTSHYQQVASGVRDPMFRDFTVVRGTRYFYYVRASSLNFPAVLGPRSNVAEILVPPWVLLYTDSSKEQ
ncbi:MAG: hypothetical protein KF749_10590 [Bacteroidetes bacterium]|nr:hypothetical protein [Bacteroidota bacterium]MCW5895787.1 hypothetical protein [Bacteroidota bacterium]